MGLDEKPGVERKLGVTCNYTFFVGLARNAMTKRGGRQMMRDKLCRK